MGSSWNPNPDFVEWTPAEIAALKQLCNAQKGELQYPLIALQLANLNEEGALSPLLRQLRRARGPIEIQRMVGGREKKASDTRKYVPFTPDETATVMRLVQEQEGDRNWAEIAAKLNQANKGGALNPELHQCGRTRSNKDVRQKVSPLLKRQQYPEEGQPEQPQRERDEVQRDHKRARSPISSPFADITNKVRMGTRKRKPTTKVEENC